MTRRILALSFACLLLSACQTRTDLSAADEAALWAAAGKQARRDCGPLMGRQDKAVAADACIAAIVRKTVLPYAVYPDLTLKLMDEQAQVSRDFQAGALDAQQSSAKAQYLQQQYEERVRARAAGG